MNKSQLIHKVKSMKFPEDSFVVFGSDVMKWKKASGGEKHLKDVEQIEKYIKSK